jgi:tetratricopeptide (TPR) repeat protein
LTVFRPFCYRTATFGARNIARIPHVESFMAKQRPQPKPKGQSASTAPRAARGAQRLPGRRPKVASAPPASKAPAHRSTYFDAVAVYERGLESLQRHDYAAAVELLRSVLTLYPEEKELHERVRLYLNICERQAVRLEAVPRTVDERLYASTLAINGGRYDEAISHLRLVRDEDPDNDHALYMLAVAHAQRGELAEALAHLERSITMNPENRALARRDPDMDPLADDDAFQAILDAPSSGHERRRPAKSKSGR